jgi:predicted transcriptional regulator
MIGLAATHIGRCVYGDGLDAASARTAVPVGITCRQCPREDCRDRAFERVATPGLAELRAEVR